MSGLTVDGIAVPLEIEAEGGTAVEAHVLEQLTAPAIADGSDVAENPPTIAEGDES